MMLAIDCGNTRIKWAHFDAGRRCGEGSAELKGDVDPYAVLADALVEVNSVGQVGQVGQVCVANVAGAEVAERVATTVTSVLGVAAEFIAVSPKAHGIECGYRDPDTLGVDRWLAMIAARRVVDGPFAVICAGTAVTFDAVDAAGRHLGGLILPSDRLMIESMAKNTDQIPLVEPAGHAVSGLELLGRSTEEAVGHGTRLALAAAVDRAIATVVASLATDLSLLITGGDGRALAEWLASEATVRADLVLDGLYAVAVD